MLIIKIWILFYDYQSHALLNQHLMYYNVFNSVLFRTDLIQLF